MGQMRFFAPTPDKLPAQAVEQAYLAGLEAIPWCSHNQWSDGYLLLERASSESGCLYLPWNAEGFPGRVLSTCSLMDRPQPYCLPVEVARGTLHRARSLAVELEAADTAIPPATQADLRTAMSDFLRASTASECCHEPAEAVIQRALTAIQTLIRCQWQQQLAAQQTRGARLNTLLAGRLDCWPLPESIRQTLPQAFNSVYLPFKWRDIQPEPGRFEWQLLETQVEWCRSRDLKVIAGPLLQLDQQHLPDWVSGHGSDFSRFERAAVNFIHQVTQRFASQVGLWCCAGGLNVSGTTSFCEEQKLRTAVISIEAVHRSVPESPVMIRFDQPWAEYLVMEDFDLSPLHFADALVRADLGLSAVALEINLGYWPGGTLPRDLLEISRHIDRWNQLDIPLVLELTLPSNAQPDPAAHGKTEIVTGAHPTDGPAAMNQQEMTDLLPLLCTKPAVQGLVWGQLSDHVPHALPHAGLYDANGQPKPLVQHLIDFRRDHLA